MSADDKSNNSDNDPCKNDVPTEKNKVLNINVSDLQHL